MTSLYIHIPFCKKKCNYCDFVSYAGKEKLIDEYVDTLCQEISSIVSRQSSVETIFFGGGTPTLLSPTHFDKIIKTIIGHLSFDIYHSETSVEANPGTANKTKLKEIRQLGINRLSIGAQSFNDQHLKTLGRIHNSKDIFHIFDDARAVGFDNINLDLMFALPNQTLDEWENDLQTAIALKPEHLSTYNLQIEEGTPFAQSYPSSPPGRGDGGEGELVMYEYTIETLISAGYKHYEISNFAKPGFACQHNIVYWQNGNYIGIGAGAHSHVNGKRWANPNCIEKYLNSSFAPQLPPFVPNQSEAIFMGLRLLDGLAAEKFNGFEKDVNELIELGLLVQENNYIKLTRQGLYLANEVFARFV